MGVLSAVGTGALINISFEAPAIDDAFSSEVVPCISIDLPVGVENIVVVAPAAIVLEFVVPVSYAVDVLAGVRLDTLTAMYSDHVKIVTTAGIGIVDADGLSPVMTALGCIIVSTFVERVINILLNNVSLRAHRRLGLPLCFAGLNALVPRVLKLHIASSSAFFEPRTAATATTHFAGFLDGSAFWTYWNVGCCRDCKW